MGDIQCPYCNHEYENDDHFEQDEKWEEQCPKCEEYFEAQISWHPTIKSKRF